MSDQTKEYLGDAVYVDFVGTDLILTTEDGYSATNTVVLEESTYDALARYVGRLKERNSTPEQWEVWVIGPDDILDFPDELSALRHANFANAAAVSHRAGHENDPNWPFFVALARARNSKEAR